MPLPQPNLDDRRFQDLVDEAKRFVQQRCPEWTDHNVSDPGVTLIEAFAHMVDQVVYRLNRIPDKNHLALLDLVGVRLFPPAAARTDVTFWLSAPQQHAVTVLAGSEIATARTETTDAVVFATEEELVVPPCELVQLAALDHATGQTADRTRELADGQGTPCFPEHPQPGDAVLFGLSTAVPSCAVALRLDFPVRGHGVNPDNPPLVWEAWTGEEWTACDVETDGSGGFNRPGDVIVHVPAGHTASVEARKRAGWLRCRVVPNLPGQPAYSASPVLLGAIAFTVGGTTRAVHAERVTDEVLGRSEGVPGQRFVLARAPLVAGEEPLRVVVPIGDRDEVWYEVADFARSTEGDRHITVDRATGEVAFGPALREPDGTLRRHGTTPPRGSTLRVPEYRTGGGRRGNVAARALAVLRSSIPYIARVENRQPAVGGVDGEDVANARVRGPLVLRSGQRAVTAADFEELAREAAPGVGRVRCVATDTGADAGGVRLLLVPRAHDDGTGRLEFGQLACSDELLRSVARHLDERRLVGTRLVVEPPYYQGVTVVAALHGKPGVGPERLRQEAADTLYRYLNPLTGGPDGNGWPFGRTVQAGEVFAALQRLDGVDTIDSVKLFPADPVTGQRGEPTERIHLEPHALVFSYEHQIRVTAR
ncbi:putative baseplate assembly protein [Yinghuangia seranimata]|uniref:putative baseplate assembly protein n=1 Tax=Yinghuangia seranimata TaxID=408067 RepID=UPI00248CDDCC|nr:putative baseplate assembly protein [Yinghuangia seranimata]MDI2125264.1 putative baseplate assembly protein [Yinghuangia seranimata]